MSSRHYLLWGALACTADICRVTGDIGSLDIGCAGYHIGTLGPEGVDKLRRMDRAALAPATAESNSIASARWLLSVMPEDQMADGTTIHRHLRADVSTLQTCLFLLSKLDAKARRILSAVGFEGAVSGYADDYAEALSAPMRAPRTNRVLLTITDAQRTAMLFTGTREARLAYAERELKMEPGTLHSFKDLSEWQLARLRRCLSGEFAAPQPLKLAA